MKARLATIKGLFPVLVFLVLAVVPAAAKGTQENRQYVDEFDNDNFTQIELNSGIRLEFQQSSFYSIKAYGKARDLDQLAVTQNGRRLKIGTKSFWPGNQDLRLVVTAPDLERLKLSSGCQAVLGLETGRELEAELSAGSSVQGHVQAERLLLKLSSGSQMSVTGGCADLDLDASAGARMDSPRFTARTAAFDLSAGSQVYLEITESAEVNASAGACLRYRGDPRLKLHLSAGANVEHVD